MTAPRAPGGLGAPGRRLWRDITSRYDLEPHELELLRRAVVCADLLDGLEARFPDVEAARDWRLTAIVLSRLLGAMKLPADSSQRPGKPGSQPLRSVGM